MSNNNSAVTIKLPLLITIAGLIIIIAGLMSAVSIVNSILMGLFISIVAAQPILWLRSKKVPLTLSVLLVLFGISSIFILFTELMGNSLASFSNNVDAYEANLTQMGKTIMVYLEGNGINLSISKLTSMFDASKVMNLTAGFLGQLGNFMGNALTILFLALFLLLEMDELEHKLKVILRDSTNSYSYIDRIGQNIRHYLSIKTLTSFLTGVLVYVSLLIVGLDYAILWALIAFMLNYIPNIGSIIAAFPAVLFSLIQLGIPGVIWTTIIFVAVNMIIGNVIEPKVMGKGLGLSTYVVFLSLIFWGFVLGPIGMFLSVPLTMALKIMLEQHDKTKWLAVILGTQDEAESIMEKKH